MIEFGALTTRSGEGVATIAPPTARGSEVLDFGIGIITLTAWTPPRVAYGRARIAITAVGSQVTTFGRGQLPPLQALGFDGEPAPSVAVGFGEIPSPLAVGSGSKIKLGEGGGDIAISARGADVGDFGIGVITSVRARGLDALPPMLNFGALFASPGYAYGYSESGYFLLDGASAAAGSSAVTFEAWPTIRESVAVAVSASAGLSLIADAAANVSASSAVNWAWQLIATATAAGTDVATALREYTLQIAETLVANGLTDTIRTSLISIGEAALVEDMARYGVDLDALSDAEASDLVVNRMVYLAEAMAQAVAAASATPNVRFVLNAPDAAAAVDSASLQRTLFFNIIESGSAFVTINLGDGENFTAWVMNPSTKSFVEYQNYPFNSMCRFDGGYFGASANGLYELEVGDDDDGEPIDAWLRTAINSIGSTRYKRIESVYLGLHADGRMMLKVISSSDDKKIVQDWFELRNTQGDTLTENSYKPGQGIKSVYYAFEIANIGGADFSVDMLQMVPIIIDRRF